MKGGLDQAAGPVKEHQDEVDDPSVVRKPEEIEDAAAGVGEGKGVDDSAQEYKQDAGEAWNQNLKHSFVNLI